MPTSPARPAPVVHVCTIDIGMVGPFVLAEANPAPSRVYRSFLGPLSSLLVSSWRQLLDIFTLLTAFFPERLCHMKVVDNLRAC